MKLASRITPNVMAVFLVIVFFVIVAVSISERINDRELSQQNEIKSYTELLYCSDLVDSQCQENVVTINYTADGRNDLIAEEYDYKKTSTFDIKIDEVEIKLNGSAKDQLVNEMCIFNDVNDNKMFDEDDLKLACSNTSKKRVVFESVNTIIPSKKVGPRFVAQKSFFIVAAEGQQFLKIQEVVDGEIEKKPFIDEAKTKSVNVADSRSVEDRGSVVDLSLFSKTGLVDLPVDEFLADNPQFTRISNNTVTLDGEIEFTKDTIIPVGLRVIVKPSTNIRLGADVSLLSYSPVNYEGNESGNINITSIDKDRPFGSVAMIGGTGNKDTVNINYLNISNGSEDEINGAYLSGMFSVYRFGKVNITNSSFKRGMADDGLNIKNSPIEMRDNFFKENSADAFDGDFVVGVIEDNIFIDNGNDSLDFSGSDVSAINNIILNSGDKCVSVGEGTKIYLNNNILDSCSIGVEVKDRSDANIDSNLIINSKNYALGSYVKKAFFGEAKTVYSGNIFIGNNQQTTGLIDKNRLDDNFTSGSVEQYVESIKWLNDLWGERSNAGE